MADSSVSNIALVGNPNTGKTSLFNQLTGLNQRVGNYPGITVDKKTGVFKYQNREFSVIDLPGAYNIINPKSEDEKVAREVISGLFQDFIPELIVYTADASSLRRSLILFDQLKLFNPNIIIALNQNDVAQKKGVSVNIDKLSEYVKVPVVKINARTGEGIDDLKKTIASYSLQPISFNPLSLNEYSLIDSLKNIDEALKTIVVQNELITDKITQRIDEVVTHKVFGMLIFIGIMFLVFQSIYSWSEKPMMWIESLFVFGSNKLDLLLPDGTLKDLLLDGIIAGLSGILVFIPQIAFLFFFISILEDSGYMARVTYLFDNILRRFGLNGKSIVPLLSGMACAVPAILGARTISNKKERLITILVTPLISCSARIPVYTLLIALVIPNYKILGIFNLKGLVLLGLYFLGFIAALAFGLIFSKTIKTKEPSYFIIEMPTYQLPRWKNVLITMFEKVKVFVTDAGKIILAISVILWFLASYGPGESTVMEKRPLNESYLSEIGKTIEPAIKPLGYNWKIGIALLSSFAAREVFVGTMATIYNIEDPENISSITQKMKNDVFESGEKVYSAATGVSLMIFYAFAMQCMSTLAITYRETKHIKWPLIQFLYMSALAYCASFIVYQIMR
jgi:ferrous iron transport protein B